VPGSPISAGIFLDLLILTISFELSELLAAALVKPHDLPKLDCLSEYPRVAVLYFVCDDLVPIALSQLSGALYPNADVFILDDSSNTRTKRLIDATGFRVIRRQGRTGYKAGNLNHWLWQHGKDYKYFLILDSDSIVPQGFLDSMIKYAEHPANAHVAIFNSVSECWNIQSRFSRHLSLLASVHNWTKLRLSNIADSVLSTGHNNLHRSQAIIDVGGFDENFIAEDISITLKLVRAGYASRLVNLIAYEAEPENIFSYVRRTARWAKQTIQIHRANWKGIPLSIKFQMFRLTWMYVSFFLYPIWALLTAWGTSSSLTNLQGMIGSISNGEISPLRVLTPFCIGVAFPLIFLLPKIPVLITLEISIINYVGSCLLSLAIGFYSMLHVCWAQIMAATNSEFAFDTTDKDNRSTTLWLIISHHWQLIPFWLFLAIGFWQNPISLFLSLLWVLILILAPLIIYLFHGDNHPVADLTSTPIMSEVRGKKWS